MTEGFNFRSLHVVPLLSEVNFDGDISDYPYNYVGQLAKKNDDDDDDSNQIHNNYNGVARYWLILSVLF